MALSSDNISELRKLIHTHLSQVDISSMLAETLRDQKQSEDLSEDELLSVLQQRGILNEIMSKLRIDSLQLSSTESLLPTRPTVLSETEDRLHRRSSTSAPITSEKLNNTASIDVDPTKRYIYVELLRGKAFLDHLTNGSMQGRRQNIGDDEEKRSSLTINLSFRGQRFRSAPVACACEPNISEGFLLEILGNSAGDRMVDSTYMLSVADPIHVVVVRTEPSGDKQVVSATYIEWRIVLCEPSSQRHLTVELMGTGAESKVPVGVLDVRVELIPRLGSECLSADVVNTQLNLERARRAERDRLFLVYAKQWWKEFIEIRPKHDERYVKIFAQDENATNRVVCSYVRRLRAGRLLESPRAAARFVSLMGYEKTSSASLGGSHRAEQWSSIHTLLCVSKGDCEDHSILLCSLLLGFGLDAYVCVGTKAKGALHSWVLTIATDGSTTFWESLTGHRYTHRPVSVDDLPMSAQQKPTHPYRTVGSLFNHESFYANSQTCDGVESCVFNLKDESRWKSMSVDALRSVCGGADYESSSLTPLSPSLVDPTLISNQLEHDMRGIVTQHRQDQGLSTVWDDELSYILTMALSAYETDRVTGVCVSNEEFQQAVRRAVPEGHTFKGYPIQFIHHNSRRAFYTSLKSPVCEEIVNCRGDQVKLALRVSCYAYPESTCATWIMFACKYKSVL